MLKGLATLMNKHPLTIFFALIAVLGLVVCVPAAAEAKTIKKTVKRVCYKGFCPASVSITKGADEKQFDNPVTRCLTPEIKALNDKSLKIMEADIKAHGGKDPAAEKLYRERLAITWSAMHEPYCGYGSNGVAAVKHSFDKSVAHARNDFLVAVK
jgi:hypothetical protein